MGGGGGGRGVDNVHPCFCVLDVIRNSRVHQKFNSRHGSRTQSLHLGDNIKLSDKTKKSTFG